jgi:hypothetical protein
MLEEFGPERVRDTPISEAAIAGAATGAALMGMRPVMEVMFMDFLTISTNQLVNAGRQDALHVRRQVQHPHGDPRSFRLGHRRRRPAFAKPGSLVCERAGYQGGGAFQSVRCQGFADRGHPG